MKFLTENDRINLFAEYEQLHAEVRERNQRTWLIDTILVTGSLLIVFQSNIDSVLIPLVSLILMIIAFYQHVTGQYVNSISFQTIAEIRRDLGLSRTNEMYKSRIKGKYWFILRAWIPYSLFTFLIGVYSYLLLQFL